VSYLVDTNVFSELVKPRPDARVVAWLRDHERDLYVSTITIGELRRGIERLPSGKKRMALQVWLTGVCQRMDGRILSCNAGVAHVWGQLMAGWEKRGMSLPSLDSQLAATAHRHGLTMVTRNVADFRHTGVKLLNPSRTT
jgi:predicted nucleic acid-binding protein